MHWTQDQLEAETPSRIETLAWLLNAERVAAMPSRLVSWTAALTDADRMRLEMTLYPQDPPE